MLAPRATAHGNLECRCFKVAHLKLNLALKMRLVARVKLPDFFHGDCFLSPKLPPPRSRTPQTTHSLTPECIITKIDLR